MPDTLANLTADLPRFIPRASEDFERRVLIRALAERHGVPIEGMSVAEREAAVLDKIGRPAA